MSGEQGSPFLLQILLPFKSTTFLSVRVLYSSLNSGKPAVKAQNRKCRFRLTWAVSSLVVFMLIFK